MKRSKDRFRVRHWQPNLGGFSPYDEESGPIEVIPIGSGGDPMGERLARTHRSRRGVRYRGAEVSGLRQAELKSAPKDSGFDFYVSYADGTRYGKRHGTMYRVEPEWTRM